MKTIAEKLIDSLGENCFDDCTLEDACREHKELIAKVINEISNDNQDEFNWYLFSDGSCIFFEWDECKIIDISQIKENEKRVREVKA